MHPKKFLPFLQKMEEAEVAPEAISAFRFYYNQLLDGASGHIREDLLQPVGELPDADLLEDGLQLIGKETLPRTVMIKLNGGLGTSMGLEKAKSLLPVKEGKSFLDIIASQVLCDKVPLLLMNSFSTDEDTLRVLQGFEGLRGEIPLTFLQNKSPKISRIDFSPATYATDPDLEWCPPGHGDIYTALLSGKSPETGRNMLDTLLHAGFETAFVSNSDNLGATLDAKILGFFVRESLPFMMEVADRTTADRKGGHLARSQNGGLLLREKAQCHTDDNSFFQDIAKYRYFNTNNLWLDLRKLKEVLEENHGVLGLPLICNEKTVDPRNPDSMPVYQLETAMGSAIEIFRGAGAIRVPRTRFAPVKSCSDLLAVRSDAFILDTNFRVRQNPERKLPNLDVDLQKEFYGKIDDFEKRFFRGIPSLLDCESLRVQGNVTFGGDVTCRGRVEVLGDSENPVVIPDGSVLEGTVSLERS